MSENHYEGGEAAPEAAMADSDELKRLRARYHELSDSAADGRWKEDRLEREIDALEAQDDSDIPAEEIETRSEPAGSQLLAPEPRDESLIGKAKSAMGFGCKMVEKKWSGLPMWVCPKCKFDTFDADRAKRHRC